MHLLLLLLEVATADLLPPSHLSLNTSMSSFTTFTNLLCDLPLFPPGWQLHIQYPLPYISTTPHLQMSKPSHPCLSSFISKQRQSFPFWPLLKKIWASSILRPAFLLVSPSPNHTSQQVSLLSYKPSLSLHLSKNTPDSHLHPRHPAYTLFITSHMHCPLLWI